MKVIAVTGHRPETFGCPYAIGLGALERVIRDNEALYLVGGARGTDREAAALCRKLGRPYAVYLPFPVHITAARWNGRDRARLIAELAGAIEVHTLSEHYRRDGYWLRNKAMVDAADAVLALWDERTTGGTAQTARYAISLGKPVTVITPSTGAIRPVNGARTA